MPTGTRSSISTNSATKPRMATASVLTRASFDRLDLILAAEQLGMEDEPVGAHGDQQHRGGIADPGHQEERPNRQPQVESQNVIGAGRPDLVVKRVGLDRDHKQQHQRGEYIDPPLQPRADAGVEQVDGDVGAAVARCGDTPEDQDAEQQPAEIVGIRYLNAEEIAQQNRDENVGSDNADEESGDKLDAVDEPVHRTARPRQRGG